MIIRNNRQVKHIYHDGKLVKERYRNGKLVHKEEQGGGEDNYTLRFTPEGNTTVTFNGWVSSMNVEYSKDNTHWTALSESATEVSVDNGEVLYVRGDNPNGLNSSYPYLYIRTTSKTIVSGDIMSLIYPLERLNTKVIPCDYCFTRLFWYAEYIDIDEDFKLSPTTLASGCYSNMFNNCSSLTTAPQLPALTLASNCYDYMFSGCRSLLTAPQLPALTLASNCYNGMFSRCSSLVTPPQLPALTLASNCYNGMFSDCSKLLECPELPSTKIKIACYQAMFSNCSKITKAPQLPATLLESNCYYGMFNGCSALKTAPELPATNLASNCYNRMFSGCSALKTAPELPATRLTSYCYGTLFKGCSNIDYIKVSATSWSTSNATDWVSGVSSTGTFVKPSGVSIPTGTSGIPEGWTVEEF